MSTDILQHAPFKDFLVPGLLLTGGVGGVSLAASGALLWGRRLGLVLSAVAGVLLCGFIAGELVLVTTTVRLQVVYVALGGLQLLMALDALSHRDDPIAGVADFLAADRVAFVGLSTDPQDFSRHVAEAMIARGQQVVPIHPTAREVAGLPAYRTVADIETPPKAALFMVPQDQAAHAVDDCISAGVHVIWFHRGVGAGSATPDAVRAARAAGLAVITDACPLMFLGPVGGAHRFHRWARGLAA